MVDPGAEQISSPRHVQAGTEGSPDARLTAKIASDTLAHRDVYALRHSSYLAYGYIDPMPDSLFADDYDEIPTSKTIVIYKDATPVASARVTLFAPDNGADEGYSVPDSSLFQEEMIEFIQDRSGFYGRPARAADISRLSRHPDFIDDKNLAYALFRMIGYVVLHFGVDVIFAAVRSHHVPFYRRMGFRPVAAPRPYPHLNFQPGLVAWSNPTPDVITKTLPIFDALSVEDPEYEPFIAGNSVPVRLQAMNKSNIQTGAAALRSYMIQHNIVERPKM